MPKTAAFTNVHLVFSLAVSFILFSSCGNGESHSFYQPDTVDVASIRFGRTMHKFIQLSVAKKNEVKDRTLPGMKITDSLPKNWRYPANVIEKELIVKFYLRNRSDSLQQVYFYPGAYFEKIRVLKLSNGTNIIQEIPLDSTPPKWRLGFRLIQLQPRDSVTFFARLDALRTSSTFFSPLLLQKEFIDSFVSGRIQSRRITNMITHLVVGIMLMMIVYSIAVARLNRSKEFFYYCGYAFFMGLLLFLKSYLLFDFSRFNFFFESYWDFVVQCLGVGCYLEFIRHFLDTKTRHPFLEKTFRISEWLIGGLLVIYTLLYFLTDYFVLLDFFENFTKQLMLVIGLIFVVYGIRRNDRFMRYLVWGNILLILFSIISFLLIVTPFKITSNPSFSALNEALLYYEIGLVLELMMFLFGLAFKNRRDLIERTRESERLKLENERKEMEKQMAVLAAQQQERDRISADMHDELGSGVTAIRLMSEIVKSKMKEATLPEVDKISNSANDLITKMNTIIWTMTSSNDSIESLVTYIRTYAFEFFESTNIECSFQMPDAIPKIDISGERRRNIFLAVKEALNNVMKHSKATKVKIDITVSEKLTIIISDNGPGIDLQNIRRFGNGLRNMQSRLENIGGKFSIRNHEGTIAIFEIAL